MSRHSDELERLCIKLRSRYGELDPLVLQVRAELETCKHKEASVVKAQDAAVGHRHLYSVRQREFTRSCSS